MTVTQRITQSTLEVCSLIHCSPEKPLFPTCPEFYELDFRLQGWYSEGYLALFFIHSSPKCDVSLY